jgi:hypothetical protein
LGSRPKTQPHASCNLAPARPLRKLGIVLPHSP